MGKNCCGRGRRAKLARPGFVESVAGLVGTSRMTMMRGECTATIDLATLATRPFDGEPYVCLADLWAASMLPGDVLDLAFDFVGEDGFRTSARCASIDGAMLPHGYLHASRRDLHWDVALPCAYRVRGVAMILAEELRSSAVLQEAFR